MTDQRAKILEAIKKQRWFFFRNKPTVLMDGDTGLLWANLDLFPYKSNNNFYYTKSEISTILNSYNFNNIPGFIIPDNDELCKMIADNSFPFAQGRNWRIKNDCYYFVNYNHSIQSKDLDVKKSDCGINLNRNSAILPCSDFLIRNTIYNGKRLSSHNVLDLFEKHKLQPIFDDEEISLLYQSIYVDKTSPIESLPKNAQVKAKTKPPVKEFDYLALLAKYDLLAIDNSPIKYYQAIQQWIGELMDKLDYYEQAKESVIQDFNLIGLQLAKKYEANSSLTAAENQLLAERQRFFQRKFALGMNSVKAKILTVKRQADQMEDRLDEIDSGEDPLGGLAQLEQEKRVSFALIAENTAKIIRNALVKMEYFEDKQQFVLNAIKIWAEWSEDYRVFKTTYQGDLQNTCQEDGIEAEIWQKWYADWQALRYALEQKIQPLIERGLKEEIPTVAEAETPIIEQIIAALAQYKDGIDQFYLEDRKGIYQKFAFQPGGDLQDKFQAESDLYDRTFQFHTALQEIIFNCSKAEDRVFILNWANSLLDLQIDEILSFVADQDLQKISKVVLEEFAKLKQKNFEIYLTDAKAYSEEKALREKQYNSLIYKMRRDLME